MSAAPEIPLRAARADDQGQIAAVYWRAWHESHAPFIPPAVVRFRDLGFFRRRVEALEPPPVVAVEAGRVLGFVAWRGARLDQLWLLPEARGLGLGRRLLAHAEAEMAAAGQARLHLDCMVGNEAARRFYAQNGWAVVGRHDKPLGTAGGEVGVPVWRMEKALAAAAG